MGLSAHKERKASRAANSGSVRNTEEAQVPTRRSTNRQGFKKKTRRSRGLERGQVVSEFYRARTLCPHGCSEEEKYENVRGVCVCLRKKIARWGFGSTVTRPSV